MLGKVSKCDIERNHLREWPGFELLICLVDEMGVIEQVAINHRLTTAVGPCGVGFHSIRFRSRGGC